MSEEDHECLAFMEEGRAGGNVRERTDETTRSNVLTIEEDKSITSIEEDRPLCDSVKRRLESLGGLKSDEEETEGTTRKLIQKVPDVLLKSEKLKEYFEPKTISVGPWQCGENLELEVTEKMKLKIASTFIKAPLRADKEHLYLRIRKKIKDLKECYVPEAIEGYSVSTYDCDDELALMFLIDGCVVLNFISSFEYFRKRNESLDGLELLEREYELRFAMDLFLLNNQLPYEVLDILMRSCKNVEDTDDLRESVKQFTFHKSIPENPTHLLELLWRRFNQPDRSIKKSCRFVALITQMPWPCELSDIIRMLLFPLIWFVRRILVVIVIRIIYVMHGVIKPHRRIRKGITLYTAQELKLAGIELLPNDADDFTNITFSDGTLKVPPISVNKSAASMFLNLAAYEMTNPSIKPEVRSFFLFFSTLISKTEDIKELRDSKILYNYLDSDKDALELFKELNTPDLITPDVKTQCQQKYLCVYKEIQKHLDNEINVWIAELKQEYFRSPWTVMAFFGAILGLVLAGIQALYLFVGTNK